MKQQHKAAGWQPYHLHVPTVLKSGNLNLLEPLWPVQACDGIALPMNVKPQLHYLKTKVTV